MKQFLLITITLFILLSCQQNPKISTEEFNPAWKETFPGVWKSIVNQPEDFNLLSVANKEPRAETLNKKPEQNFPIPTEEIKAFTKNGKTYLRFPLEREEQIYGLGLNFKTVQQRGRI
ncbi:MAG: hypothetical protein R3182_04485, partial [Draconibacterium sp.]|nr:hypothetical protein [Draconibacterium sp.]